LARRPCIEVSPSCTAWSKNRMAMRLKLFPNWETFIFTPGFFGA